MEKQLTLELIGDGRGHIRVEGMSFDTEVLFIARKKGFSIKEVPIDWYFNPDSRVRLIQDSMRMALDLITIRRNARKGLYDGQA